MKSSPGPCPVTAPLTPPLVSGLSVFDADAAGKQETLMGHVGSLYFWSEYPPGHEEYERAVSPLD